MDRFPFRDTNDGSFEPELTDALTDPKLVKVELPLGGAAWLACRHADVKSALKNRSLSRSEAESGTVARMSNVRVPKTALMGMDGPRHLHIRRTVGEAFTGERVRNVRGSVSSYAKQCLQKMLGPAPADVVPHLREFCLLSVGCILGFNPEQCLEFDRLVSAVTSVPLHEPELRAARAQLLNASIGDWLDQPKSRDGINSSFREVIASGQLSHMESVEVVKSLFMGGVGAPTSLLAGLLAQIATDEALRLQLVKALVGGQLAVERVVEEFLRVVPTGVAAAARVATFDTIVGSTVVRAGEVVVPVTRAANMDRSVFDRPQSVDLNRAGEHSLSFGYGSHFCPGSSLARLEVSEFLRALQPMLGRLELGRSGVHWAAESTSFEVVELFINFKAPKV